MIVRDGKTMISIRPDNSHQPILFEISDKTTLTNAEMLQFQAQAAIALYYSKIYNSKVEKLEEKIKALDDVLKEVKLQTDKIKDS